MEKNPVEDNACTAMTHQGTLSSESVELLNKCDEILLVEGSTDKRFYEKYEKYEHKLFFTKQNIHQSTETIKKLSDLRFDPVWKNDDKDNSVVFKERIKILIENKTWTCADPHFYGIVDKDYGENGFPETIKNYITETDAHSLETMLLKYAGEKHCVEFLTAFLKKRTRKNLRSEKEIRKICDNSMNFALKIGYLRKKKGGDVNKQYDFGKICEAKSNFGYLDYLTGSSIKNLCFDFDKYIGDLIDSFKANTNNDEKYKTEENISIEQEELNNIIKQAEEHEQEKFNLCQGHDVVALIDVMCFILYGRCYSNYRAPEYKKDEAGIAFIDAFDIDWFKGAKIDDWLCKKDGEVQEAKKEVQEAKKTVKFKNFILPVANVTMAKQKPVANTV